MVFRHIDKLLLHLLSGSLLLFLGLIGLHLTADAQIADEQEEEHNGCKQKIYFVIRFVFHSFLLLLSLQKYKNLNNLPNYKMRIV